MIDAATIDFETRSMVDLKKQGGWVYSRHWSTVALCLSWAYHDAKDPEETHLWHPAFPAIGLPEEGAEDLRELHERVRRGLVMEAHNAFFERVIWGNVMSRLGWPAVHEDQWRCTAAKAASYALPRKLEGACAALGTPHQKDLSGAREMLRLSKPRKPTRRDPLSMWYYSRESFETLFRYCRGDVLAEKDLSLWLRDIPEIELRAWRIDQRINLRGVACDRAMVEKGIELAAECVAKANRDVEIETGGEVTSTKQVAKIRRWLEDRCVYLPNLNAATVEAALEDESLPGFARVVLESRRAAAKSSVSKYQSMSDRMDPDDDRVRDILLFHAAGTGRWAGAGIQVQNYPSRGLIEVDPEILCADVLACSREELELLYGDPMRALSTALRPTLIAGPGMELFAADFAAIEACGTFWIAGDDDALAILAAANRGEGPKMYAVMAGEIFGVEPRAVKKNSSEYNVGKQAILGLGYQMGDKKFVVTCRGAGVSIDKEMSERVVDTYRGRFYKVVDFWKATQEAAILATKQGPGKLPIEVGRTRWAVRGRFLHCRLPSGRLLSYYAPRVELKPKEIEARDGTIKRFIAETLTYMDVDQKTRQWRRTDTYGGKLTENVVQAVSRDILRDSMIRLEDELEAGRQPYETVMTVHDEIVSSAPIGVGDLKVFEGLVEKVEPWAAGIPVKAEGWRGRRYRK